MSLQGRRYVPRRVIPKKLVSFIFQELGYVGGVVPPDPSSKKWLNIYIQTYWIIEAKSKEERKNADEE